MFNSGQIRYTLYSLFLSSLALHVSGAICTHHQEHNCSVQTQVVYLWKTEVLVASGMDVYFVWFCVFSFFKASRDIFVLVCVCVSLDLFRYCVVIMCDFLVDSLGVPNQYLPQWNNTPKP
jgi:hypothetical protein